MTFRDVRSSVFETHAKGDYQASLDAIDAYRGESDDEQFDLSFWRVCLLSRFGRTADARAEFSRRMDQAPGGVRACSKILTWRTCDRIPSGNGF